MVDHSYKYNKWIKIVPKTKDYVKKIIIPDNVDIDNILIEAYK